MGIGPLDRSSLYEFSECGFVVEYKHLVRYRLFRRLADVGVERFCGVEHSRKVFVIDWGGAEHMEQKIVLSPATLDDVEFIVDEKTDAALWFYDDGISSDRDAVRRKVVERIGSDWYKQYVIRLNCPGNVPVGELHIHWYTKERESWEIGYCVFPEHRRQGYCTEAAKLALRYAFEDWNAHKVVAMCHEHNTASYKVMEKLGMTREGVFREELPWQGGWADQYFYSILESEYFHRYSCR